MRTDKMFLGTEITKSYVSSLETTQMREDSPHTVRNYFLLFFPTVVSVGGPKPKNLVLKNFN